jgi:polar amino acid transport system substrate-binding protein
MRLLKIVMLLAFIVLIFCPGLSNAEEEINFAITPWPPWTIYEEDGTYSGYDVDIMTGIAKRLNLKLVFKKCPWKRCLNNMKTGQYEIISQLLKRPEREEYLHFIEPPYISKTRKVFYLLKSKNHDINKHEDLHKVKEVGVVLGNKYYDSFDDDPKINKDPVKKEIQLLGMLKLDRIDTFIGTENQIDYLILTNPEFKGIFKKASYYHDEENLVYFAISRKSKYAKRLGEFNEILNDMLEKGIIQEYINKYSSR